MAFLARQGMASCQGAEEQILSQDIRDLFYSESHDYAYAYCPFEDQAAVFVPAIFRGERDTLLCKSWIKKKCSQTKKFVKKHKKAILIGTVIVIAATVVICVVAASSASAAAIGAASAAGAKGSCSSDHDAPKSALLDQADIQSETSIFNSSEEFSVLKGVMNEQFSTFNEMVLEEPIPLQHNSFIDTSREVGAFLAHEVLEGVSQLAVFIPELAEEIKEIGEALAPGFLDIPLNEGQIEASPIENYEKLLAAGHQKIDQIFSTVQADQYTPEAKANHSTKKLTIGMLPLPGLLETDAAAASAGRLAVTQASNVRGWKLGQPIINRTIFGTVPKWSTVRRRYWKTRAEWAKSNSHDYGIHNIPRMERGLAPQRINVKTGKIESMELHHSPAQKDGGLFDFVEVWPDEHAMIDKYRSLGN